MILSKLKMSKIHVDIIRLWEKDWIADDFTGNEIYKGLEKYWRIEENNVAGLATDSHFTIIN